MSDDSPKIQWFFNVEILLAYVLPVGVGVLRFASDSIYPFPVAFTRPDFEVLCVNERLGVDVSICKLCLCALLSHIDTTTHLANILSMCQMVRIEFERNLDVDLIVSFLLLMQFFSYRKVHGSLCTGS